MRDSVQFDSGRLLGTFFAILWDAALASSQFFQAIYSFRYLLGSFKVGICNNHLFFDYSIWHKKKKPPGRFAIPGGGPKAFLRVIYL